MKIVFVSAGDLQGGGNLVGYRLHQEFKKQSGTQSLMIVALKMSDDETVRVVNYKVSGFWENWCEAIKTKLVSRPWKGSWQLIKFLDVISNPARYYYNWAGKDYFGSHSFKEFYQRLPWVPDIFHFHVLHGYGFNLKDLQWLSQRHRVFITLHDGWTFSGHCAHSFDCTRWITGCGNCPDLTIPPAVNRDATHFNWKRKKQIYSNSQLYIATPCNWLMEKVNQSILKSGIAQSKVISNGIDTGLFSPRPKALLRSKYGFNDFDFVILFASYGIKRKRWRNFAMLTEVIDRVGEMNTGKKTLIIALGDNQPSKGYASARLVFLPYSKDASYVAELFSMCDVYLHASNMDTFPNVVLEALSSGVPVIATAVGGIPEQVNGLRNESTDSSLNSFGYSEATGILVANNDPGKMVEAIQFLLSDQNVREILGKNARIDSMKRFSQELQLKKYSEWYKEIMKGDNKIG